MATPSTFRAYAEIALFFAFVAAAPAQYSGGSGTAQDPYRIATAADLIALGETPEDYDKHFILTADIDLDPNLPGGKVFDRAVIAPDADETNEWWRFDGTPFTGVFDGNGHTILHLRITGEGYLGLFGQLGSMASVLNLGLQAMEVSGTGYYVGGLVGSNGDWLRSEGGGITNCQSNGSVSGTSSVGGLVGFNGGTIAKCYSSGAIHGSSGVGGLVGTNGRMPAGLSFGRCPSGVVTACYATTVVEGHASVGGLVGRNERGSVTNCYSTGSVNGASSVGGLVGFNSATIAVSYSTSEVGGNEDTGGLVGSGSPLGVSACVWDTETSTLSGSTGGVGLTTAEMMDPEMLGVNGFADDPNWVLDVGRDYPRLTWEGTSGQIIPEPEIDWLEGQGTPETPYRIDTADQLLLLGQACALWNRHFVLGADINLDPATPGRAVFGQAVIPAFSGVFDGGGHIISNLTMEGGSYLGLFGSSAAGAEVRDLELVDVNVTGSGSCVAGLVGDNHGSIVLCCSSGSVRGDTYVGGLMGYNSYYGSITDCCTSGSVSGVSNVGGLLGYNSYYASITSCYSGNSVSGTEDVGGLVGCSRGSMAVSYSSGAVSGESYVGGLVGYTDGNSITNCYSSGSVSGTSRVGGLVGWNWGATSEISSGPTTRISSSFWDVETSGQTWSDGGEGKTTTEMQTVSTFLTGGWGCMPAVWTIAEGVDYPRLAWEGKPGKALPALADFVGGSGSEDAPYLIYTSDELSIIGVFSNEWDKHFKLMTDIDMDSNLPGGKILDKAVIAADANAFGDDFQGTPFTGVFDGNGHAILHLTIRGGSYLGLFGQLGSGAVVKDLGVLEVSITGSGEYIGALVGQNWGSIATSYSTGLVSGNKDVGGLVGSNSRSIMNCYSSASVSGTVYPVGGLVGYNSRSITNCYSSGAVTGTRSGVGGLVGERGWNGIVTSSFWDIETSGHAGSAGGTGLTTAEVQTAATFLEAGWDFVGETANGTEDIWWILEGQDYPQLWWELDEMGDDYDGTADEQR